MSGQARSRGAPAPAKMPRELHFMLGRPALLRAESRKAYDQLMAQCAAAVDPQDMVEWVMVRDYVDLTWEIMRLRRMKRAVVALKTPDAIFTIIEDTRDAPRPGAVGGPARATWIAGGQVRRNLCSDLALHDIDQLTINTQAFLLGLDSVEKIERLETRKEGLRRAVLRDLECYRDSALLARHRIAPDIDARADLVALPPPGQA
jgi:hypothetical protein